MKVLITGAGGYLGSVLATELASLKDVDCLTGTVHSTLPRMPLPSKVNLVKIDIRSPELAEVMVGHDYVIHSAFIVQWSAKMSAAVRDDINFNGTRNVAQAAIQNHIRGFIHASSIAAYDPIHIQGKENLNEDCPIGNGNSPMYYLNSKAIAEKILREVLESSNIPLTFFRISYITGPRDPATVRGFRENAVLFPGRNPRAQFVHENDVAQAFAQAIRTNMPGAFNVVPDDFIRLREVYKIIGAKPLTTATSSGIWGAAVGNEKHIIGWFRDAACEPPDWDLKPALSKQTVAITIPGSATDWQIDFYNTKTGTDIISSLTIKKKGNTVNIPLPTFTDDIAFKMFIQK